MQGSRGGYDLGEKLYESASSLIYRALRHNDQVPVVLKVLQPNHPSPEARRRFQREYELASTVRAEGITETCALEPHGTTLAIVEKDIGGASLAEWLTLRRPSVAACLAVVLRLAGALGRLHASSILHNDVNPANIIWNPTTGQVELIDFGAATVQETRVTRPRGPAPQYGTLAYASPEQTGRTDRVVDHRSDLYALGVTLYELLTGRLPFRADDAMMLVYGHMAQRPRAVSELEPAIPRAISDVVMKLLKKDPTDRYQSAPGLKADLEACLVHLSGQGDLGGLRLELAQHDLSPQLHISPQLYGRQAEKAALRQSFDRVSAGGAETVIIAGWSGVGKTALVQNFFKSIASTTARFSSGKLEQFRRDVPYQAITQTFNELCRDLLMQEPDVLQHWKDKLATAVGDNGRLLEEVIPGLRWLLGEQPPPPQVGSTAAKHRFNLVFLNLVHALCGEEHPLVLFLDDLQWADRSTLDLLELMATDTDARFLLLVGAYRDNEVTEGHPLLEVLRRIQSRAPLSNISLPPLTLSQVGDLLADTLPRRSGPLSSLAQLAHSKTSGNPFFLGQFLKALHERALLRYDSERSWWTWDVDSIVAQGMTENVVELMVHRLDLLPQPLQEVVQLAACVGDRFDLQTLSIVSERQPAELLRDLLHVTEAGYLIQLPPPDGQAPDLAPRATHNPEFKFLHDRVRQAAHGLIAEENQKEVHATVGRLLLRTYSPSELADQIFSVVKHLNAAHELLGPVERLRLVQLNLDAGIKARESTAYESAQRCLDFGMALLPKNSWQSRYTLCLSLHQEAASAAYLCGAYEKAFALADAVLEQAKDIYDKVRTYLLLLEMEAALLHTPRVLELTVQVLKELGISLEEEPPEGLDANQLLDLPPMTDPSARAALSVLSSCVPAAYQSDPALLRHVVYTMVKLSVRHGNDPYSAFGYVMYGLLLSSTRETLEQGYRFGQMALDVLKQSQAPAITCRVEHIFHSHIRFTTDPLRLAVDPMQETIDAGLAVGDLEFVAHVSNVRCLNVLFSSPDLTKAQVALSDHLRLMKKLRIEHGIAFAGIFQQLVLNLMGQSQDALMLVGSDFDELSAEPRLKEVNQQNLLAFLYTARIIVRYLLGDHRGAFLHAQTLLAEGYDNAMSSLYVQHVFQFYYCLVIFSQYGVLEAREQQECMAQVERYHQNLTTLSDRCPENYQTFGLLVAAEKARATGEFWRAHDLYDQAVIAAQEYQQVPLEAVANERAGSFWRDRGKDNFAAPYLRQAHRCYARWGARPKVEDLEARYPQLLTSRPSIESDVSSAPMLDIATFIKASQVIAGEFDTETLVSKVMATIVENAGAQKAVLVQARDDDFVVVAVASEQGDVTLRQEDVTEGCDVACNSIVRLVLRTGEAVLLGDARTDSRFSRDTYIARHQTRSVLCIPMLHQERLIGAVYLENNLISGAFAPERHQLLRLLANQAGISLENARLFAEKQRFSEELLQEITVRRSTEDKLRERERDLFVTLNSIGDAVIATDRNFRITRMNPVAQHLTGWPSDEALGRTLGEVFHVVRAGSGKGLRSPSTNEDDQGITRSQDAVLVARRGQEMHISDSRAPIKNEEGEAIGFVIVFRDITQQTLVEEQLRQAQKMEAVGQLAGGIAHDFNNLLTGIQGSADLLALRETRDSPTKASTDIIIDACRRASELVQKLLTFSRKTTAENELVDLHTVINNVSVMLRRSIDKRVEVQVETSAERSLVFIDTTRIQNAILNLGLNARDAMPDGGRLLIATRNVPSRDVHALLAGQVGAAEYIEIRSEDTGTGMPEEVRSRIFEPFFTTKPAGKGTGLGLSTTYNAIREASGAIDVASTVGAGTVVKVVLPVAESSRMELHQQEIRPGAVRGTGRILFVDDENTIRDVARSMLTELGYEVVVARDGLDAVELYKKNHQTIDLVILDIVMPTMSGDDAYYKLLEVNPEVQVIVSTGCDWNQCVDRLVDDGVIAVLRKPYRRDELARMVGLALEERSGKERSGATRCPPGPAAAGIKQRPPHGQGRA
jgi:PAS domain S-box-containing protein